MDIQILPNEIQNKIFYFLSHPCADMIKESHTIIRTIKDLIYRHLENSQEIQWTEVLPNILMNYNKTYSLRKKLTT
jgi:hypothetical protein